MVRCLPQKARYLVAARDRLLPKQVRPTEGEYAVKGPFLVSRF